MQHRPMHPPLCNISSFSFIATCFGLLYHHQVMYKIITKIIELYNGFVVLDLLFVLCLLCVILIFLSLIT
jgi:hypothetical protein